MNPSPLLALYQGAARLIAAASVVVLMAHTGAHAQLGNEARLDSLCRSSWSLKDAEPARALGLAREALALAGRMGDAKGQGRALQCMSAAHRNLNESDSAEMALQEALRINERLHFLPGVLSCLQKLATLHTEQGEVTEAMALLTKAELLALQLKNDEEQARTLNLKGAALETAGRYEEAIAPYFASINIRKRTGSAALAKSYQNLASLYLRMDRVREASGIYGNMVAAGHALHDTVLMAEGFLNLSGALAKHGQYDQARAYADSALALYRSTGNTRLMIEAWMNRSVALGGAGRYGLARADLDSAKALQLRANDREGLASACAIAARQSLMQHQADSALAFCERGIELAQSLGLSALRAQLMGLQAEAYQALGRYDAAVAVLNAYLVLKDSLLGEQATQQLATAEMREKYDAVERLAQVEKLRSEKQQESALRGQRTTERNILVVAAVLLALLSALLYRNLQHRRKLARQEQQIHDTRVNELLRENEVNVLNAVVNGQEAERQRVAKDLHDRLGSMLSALKHQFGALESRLDALHKEQKSAYAKVYSLLDDAVQEVRNISHDMISGALEEFGLAAALQGLRKNVMVEGRLDVELNLYGLERRLDRRLEIAAYHMVQELVANALKHARPTELSMALTRTPERLSIIVSDNGKGFDPEQPTSGMGLGNVRARADAFGGKLLIDSSLRNGTTVSIEIPLD